MRDPSDTELIEFNGWMMRIRAAALPSARPLLLLHGWTGNEDSMWVFARHLPLDYWIVAPRAPRRAKPSGFSWRVESAAGGTWPELGDLKPSVEGLLVMLDSFAAGRSLVAPAWNVIGFSQGAVVAATMAVLFPERVERVALLAGFVPPGAEDLLATSPLRGKQVFMAHGSLDETVDIELGRQAVRLLESAGANVQVCESAVGHKVSADCMRQMERFFA